jgi:DNA repair protein RecO (recombination protein O)
LRQASDADRSSLSGVQWTSLQQALGERVPLPPVLRACAEVAGALKPQLRTLLNYHCGVPSLRTRQMMIDLQSL